MTESGIEDALLIIHEYNDAVKSGIWVGDCFIFIALDRINYYVGG